MTILKNRLAKLEAITKQDDSIAAVLARMRRGEPANIRPNSRLGKFLGSVIQRDPSILTTPKDY